MSAQDSYLEWEQEGHLLLSNERKRFLQDEMEVEEFFRKSTPASAITTSRNKRKHGDDANGNANKKRATMRRDPQEHTSTPMNQDFSSSSSDMSMASSGDIGRIDGDDDNDSSAAVSITVKKKPAPPPPATFDFARRPGGAKTFGWRQKTSASAPMQLDFYVRQPGQVLGLFEGIVRETRLYIAKDFKSRVLWEGRYEEVPHKGRYKQVSTYLDPLAQGRWIVRWDKDDDNDGMSCSRTADDLQSRRFVMRHDGARGRALPKQLTSTSQDELKKDKIFINQFNPSGTRMGDIKAQVGLRKGDPFFVGSLSLFGFDGFDSSGEMMEGLEGLTRSLVSATPSSPTKSRQEPPFWTIDNGASGIAGVTLLCALSPDENPSSYQIRIAVDEKNDETIGVDVIFIGDKTVLSPASPIQLSKSTLRLLAASEATSLESKMNLDYSNHDDDDEEEEEEEDFNDNILGLQFADDSDDSGEDEDNNYAIQSEDGDKALEEMQGVEKETGDPKKSLEGHVKSKAVTSRLPAKEAGANDYNTTASLSAPKEQPSTKKVANRRVTATSIRPLGNHNSNVPKTTGARAGMIQDVTLDTTTTRPSIRTRKVDFAIDQTQNGNTRMKQGSTAIPPGFSTVQKTDEPKQERHGDEESAAHPFVTPYILATEKNDTTGGNDDDDDVDEISPFPRVLDQRFETMSVEILNEPILEVTFRSEEQADEEQSHVSGLSNGRDDESRAGDSFGGGDDYDYDDGVALLGVDADGVPLLRDGLRMDHGDKEKEDDSVDGELLPPAPVVDHHQEDDQGEEEDTTVFHKLDVALHDVFFGSHDEAALTVYGKEEEPIGIVAQDSRNYKTCLGYVWYQWMVPMSIMLTVTLPAAHFLFEHTRAMEMLHEPEPETWTEWFYSMF